MAFGIENSDEQLYWYRTPPMSMSPSSVRPYAFSQSSARGALWEEDTGDLPQQTAGTGNITCDLSSKVSIGGVQNNQKYNFDVQSNPTSFVYNNQNINNFTAIPPAIQDVIYNTTINNTTTQQGFVYVPNGLTSSIGFVSDVKLTSTKLQYGIKTLTVSQGGIQTVSNSATYYDVADVTACS